MKGKSPVEIRMELARGHFLVGEPAHALAALEAAVRENPRHPGLRPLIDELMADPSTYTVRTSLDAVRARLGASVAPVASEPVVRPKPAPIAVEEPQFELELEPLAESAGLFAKPASAQPAPKPLAASPAPAPQPVTPMRPPVEQAPRRAQRAGGERSQTAAPERPRGGTIIELERWLRNVPRIRRTEVRA